MISSCGIFCGCGGIGRRARFRSVWERFHAGSSPVIRTIKGLQNRCSPWKPRCYRGFHRLYGKISANRFDRYKNDVFPLWIDLNSRKVNIRYARQIEIKNLSAFFITLKKEKSDMLQKELAKRLKARYDTKMDDNKWMEVPSSIACVVAW